jgi:hypothetical protein
MLIWSTLFLTDHLQWVQPWMTYILTHPVVQGAIKFSNTSSSAFRNPFSLENGTHSQNTLSLSVCVHLTTYYSKSSSPDIYSIIPTSTSYSSLRCSEEKNRNSSSGIDISHVPSADTRAFHSHPQCGSSSGEMSPVPNFSSSLTILNTINNYYNEDGNYNSIPETTNLDPSPDKSTNSLPSKDWTQLGSPAVPVIINICKPLFRQVLEREMAQQIGAMAVSVCGPGGMGDEVRKAVRDIQGRKAVEFFEECFSW